MVEWKPRLKNSKAEVKRLLTEARTVDDAEDVKYGKGKRGDELPKELRFKQERLKKIKEAMKSLEAEAKAKADAKREENPAERTGPSEGKVKSAKAKGPKNPATNQSRRHSVISLIPNHVL